MSEPKTIKLGLMPPLTGLVGIYGTEIVRAAQIACDEVNQNGGVLGMPLELIIEDDGSLPDSAVVAARKLVDKHHCSAIIGNLLSNSRIAVAYQIAEPRKIPLLNFSFYEGSIQSRYFFHFAALPNQQIDRIIPYMKERYGPRMFFAGNNYEWPRGSIDAAKRALLEAGGKIVGEEYCPIGTPLEDIERLLDHVEISAPDVFVPYFAGSDQVNLLTRFNQRGLKKHIAVVMGHYDEMMASILPPEVREGFYSSNTYFMTVDSAENRNYLSRLARLPGVTGIWPQGNGILTNFGEGTYLCVKAFAQAANTAGSVDPEALVEVLKNIKVSGPQGVVTMNPASQHAAVNTYLSCCDASGKFNLVEKFGVIEPVIPERYNHQRIANQATLEEDIRLQARILEQMSDAIFLVNTKDGTIVYTNPVAEKMFGYDKNELLGKSITSLNDPSEADPQKTAADITQILNEKGEWKGEVRNVKKDGTPIWCSSSVSTFTHPVYGEVWLGVQRDITERKQNEESLRQSAERMQRVIDATNDGIWDWNILTHEDYLSPRWKEIVGYRDDELANHDSVFFVLIHPEDRELVSQAVARHFEHGEPFQVEMRLRHKDGSYRWVLSRGEAVRDTKGRPVRMLGSITDISESKQMAQLMLRQEALKASSKRSHAIIDASPVPLAINDAHGNITFLNQAFIQTTGYSLGDIPTLADWWPLAYPDPQYRKQVIDRWQVNLTQAINTNTAFAPIEIDIHCKDGSVRTFLSSAAPLEEGFTGEHLVVLYDITERKQAERTIITTRDEANRANQAKSEFLSSMSHELRTPLNAVLGFAQIMEYDSSFPQEHRSSVQEILNAGYHLLNLVNEVLDLARIESGHIDLIMESVQVCSVIEDCQKLLALIAEKNKINLSHNGIEGTTVRADHTRLKQVLLNLLSNAIKYNHEGGSVLIEVLPQGTDRLRIQVSDTGIGIAAEQMVHLFEPFNRLGKQNSNILGTGIGLTITRRIVEMMGGSVGVESKEGVGSTFWIELPLEFMPEQVRHQSAERASTHALPQTKKSAQHSVLYIEDNPSSLRLIAHLMSQHKDIHLLTAHTPELGIGLARLHLPDVILLDINMPGMDGYQVLEIFKADARLKHIPVIAITANAMPHDIERGIAAGFSSYLTKPIDVKNFFVILDRHLH